MATRELSLCLACFGFGTNIWPAPPAPVSAEGSASAGSPPASSAPPPPSPLPSPAPRRRTARAPRHLAPVASRRLACERCVRRLMSSPEVEPCCVFRVGRAKCDYCVQVGHECKRVCLALACNVHLTCFSSADRFIGSADPSKCGQAPGGPGFASP
jgi:hypothetical protein